jgi:antitoxin MazE6
MKTAVSIPDHLFHQADAFARRFKKSRSQVYREALTEYLARREPDSVTTAIDAVLDDVGTEIDPWIAEVSRAALERSEW